MFLALSHSILISVCLILKIIEIDVNTIGLIFTILSVVLTFIYIISLKRLDKRTKLLLILGFVLRIVAVIIDVFVTRLPDAGTDDDGFYNASLNLYNENYFGFSQDIYGGVFSKLLSLLYFFIGSSRLSAQYFNVLLSLIALIIIIRSLQNYRISKKNITVVALLMCLMPNAILVNSILRRETVIELCLALSIYWLSNWSHDNSIKNALLSIIMIMIASLFHTAFIFGALILIVYYTLYDRKRQRVYFSIKKTSKFIIILICAILAGISFLSLFNNKLTAVSDMDDIYSVASRSKGNSVYLENYKINNFGQLILFTPLKLFYFLFSPVPWRFRGIMDVVSFIFDVMIYIILIFKVFQYKKDSYSKLYLCMFILLSIVFAIGTFNSGTAIRHRFSLIPFLLISYSIAKTKNQLVYYANENNSSTSLLDKEKNV